MSSEKILTIDKQAVKDAFDEAIRKEATAVIKAATSVEDIARTIREAFAMRWGADRNTWLEQSVREALQTALWSSVKGAIEASGVDDMIRTAVVEHIGTPEFSEAIKRRAIETVKSTTFYVKPETEAQNAAPGRGQA